MGIADLKLNLLSMEQIETYSDNRLEEYCIYCGASPATREHVPSKILLNAPFPENLPVVPSCVKCNNGFSRDEEYLACLIECTACGTTDISSLRREKIKKTVGYNKLLHERLEKAKETLASGDIYFNAELDQVNNVVLKIAMGIAKYEASESAIGDPCSIIFCPFPAMTPDEADRFNGPSAQSIFPEIGSRSFIKMINNSFNGNSSWNHIQEGQFRYMCSVSNNISVRFVIQEYLACEVLW